jgi:glycosyltransferase involved in cell wall biosynthesis
LPSLADQWGLVVNEALASGIPVLVSQQSGASEDLVAHGLTGFVFDAQSRESILEALKNLSGLFFDKQVANNTLAGFSLRRFQEGVRALHESLHKYPVTQGLT